MHDADTGTTSQGDELIAVLAHGWLNSMGVVTGAAQMLGSDEDRLREDARAELLDLLVTQARHLHATFEDLVRSARPEVQAALDALTRPTA